MALSWTSCISCGADNKATETLQRLDQTLNKLLEAQAEVVDQLEFLGPILPEDGHRRQKVLEHFEKHSDWLASIWEILEWTQKNQQTINHIAKELEEE